CSSGLDDFTISWLPERSYTRFRSLPISVPTSTALDVKGEGVRVLVDLICAKGGLVAALRVLHRRSVGPCWRVSDTSPGPTGGHRACRQAARYSQPGEFSRLRLPLRATP